jgi:hypothetical protein
MKIEKTIVKSKPANNKPASSITAPHNPQAIHEAICLKAYELYLERKGAPGNDIEDWLKAEKSIQKDLVQMITDKKMHYAEV